MPTYCISGADDPLGEAYWALAASPKEARRLVALNVEEARDARDPGKFDCEPDNEKQPDEHVILRRRHGPVPIEKR